MRQHADRSQPPAHGGAAHRFDTPEAAAQGIDEVLGVLDGRWKLLILFHLFGGNRRRFSELERAIPAVSQKMLIQQLRQLERDGMVRRIVHPQVPPKVEYGLTDWGQALCPVLDALLKWAASRAKLQTADHRHWQFHPWRLSEQDCWPVRAA